MITTLFRAFSSKTLTAVFLLISLCCLSTQSLMAQSTDTNNIKPLRSDVGIIGLTANFMSLNSFDRLDTDSTTTPLVNDGSSELEFKLRNVRMMSQRVGVGLQLLTSFFVNDAEGEPSFGIGSWGLGPVLRAYPFKTDRLQPYIQGDMLFGNNLGVGDLANTERQGGFRVRMSLRAGVAYRVNNSLGFFVEAGSDWESGRIFKPDARALQLNFGIDLYRFK